MTECQLLLSESVEERQNGEVIVAYDCVNHT